MIRRYCNILFALAVVFMCAGCGELPIIGSPPPTIEASPTPQPASERLIGHWKNPETGYIMSFYQEGTVTYESPCGLSIGDYRFLKEDLVRVNWQGYQETPGYSQIIDIEFENDTLMITSSAQYPTLILNRVLDRNLEVASTPCSNPPS
jgi:hypothetical protein